jgi:hypothetical protein
MTGIDLAALNVKRLARVNSFEELLIPKNNFDIPLWLPKAFLEFATSTPSLTPFERLAFLNRVS